MGQQSLVNSFSIELDVEAIQEADNSRWNPREMTVTGIVSDFLIPARELRIYGR